MAPVTHFSSDKTPVAQPTLKRAPPSPKHTKPQPHESLMQTPKTVAQANLGLENKGSPMYKKTPDAYEDGENNFSRRCQETMIKKDTAQLREESRVAQMRLVEDTFGLIKEELNEHERAGKYLFRIVQCGVGSTSGLSYRINTTSHNHLERKEPHEDSVYRVRNNEARERGEEKPIAVLDLMEVELRMIRQQK